MLYVACFTSRSYLPDGCTSVVVCSCLELYPAIPGPLYCCVYPNRVQTNYTITMVTQTMTRDYILNQLTYCHHNITFMTVDIVQINHCKVCRLHNALFYKYHFRFPTIYMYMATTIHLLLVPGYTFPVAVPYNNAINALIK